MKTFVLVSVVAMVGLLAGCGTSSPKPTKLSADGAAFRLDAAPAGAKGVKQVKQDSKDGEDIVIEGRIGGDISPWVEGQAAFLVVDNSLKPCNEKDDDACETPWDYCCDTDLLPSCKAMVKIVDAKGKPLTTDARKLLGIKELQTVVVRGKAKRDAAGNLTVLADGVFVRN